MGSHHSQSMSNDIFVFGGIRPCSWKGNCQCSYTNAMTILQSRVHCSESNTQTTQESYNYIFGYLSGHCLHDIVYQLLSHDHHRILKIIF